MDRMLRMDKDSWASPVALSLQVFHIPEVHAQTVAGQVIQIRLAMRPVLRSRR